MATLWPNSDFLVRLSVDWKHCRSPKYIDPLHATLFQAQDDTGHWNKPGLHRPQRVGQVRGNNMDSQPNSATDTGVQ